MTFFVNFRDFIGGLTRGFGLFFTERNDHIISVTNPGLSGRK